MRRGFGAAVATHTSDDDRSRLAALQDMKQLQFAGGMR